MCSGMPRVGLHPVRSTLLRAPPPPHCNVRCVQHALPKQLAARSLRRVTAPKACMQTQCAPGTSDPAITSSLIKSGSDGIGGTPHDVENMTQKQLSKQNTLRSRRQPLQNSKQTTLRSRRLPLHNICNAGSCLNYATEFVPRTVAFAIFSPELPFFM